MLLKEIKRHISIRTLTKGLRQPNKAQRVAVVAVVVVRWVDVVRIEVQVVGVVRIVGVRRRRPIIAVVATVVDVRAIAIACSRQTNQT